MNASETRVSSYSNDTLELAEDGLGVSALVSRLNCTSSGSDAGSQGSPEPPEGCHSEEHRQEKNFPWLNGFSGQCRAAIGSKSMKLLDDLLTTYVGHVTPHYRDCHKLPNKAAKLKRNINDTMIFFHMLYMDIREPLENAFYYDRMTELMAMYLDLEITASRRGKDTEKTVTNKLSTSLYTFLDHSEDHILDALLKTKLINKHSKKVCVPLLRKILSELIVRRPLTELTYVRFLLSFKLWKNVVADAEERRAINKLAAQRLHPSPEYFMDHELAKPNAEVLPRVPKSKKNCTMFYLGAKFSVKDSCRAFFRYCKDTCRSNVYRRNIAGSEDIEKPFLITARSSEKITDVEENGSCSLINDIWSTISNGDSCTSLLGESDMFSDIHVEEKYDESLDSLKHKKLLPDSPDSRVETPDRMRRKDPRKKRENSVPDPKFVMLKTEGVADPLSASSPAKGVQDRCLGSVFMMEEVNKVGGAQSHVKADPSEAELPTSSRQHSVLESLVYVQPGTDNEAVASSSVSPDAGSVPTSHLDTNECDSSVEILQSRQVATDVGLPLELKPPLNIDEDLRSGKASKEDLLLFSGGDSDPFSEFNMFRLNDDIFNCRSAFEGMDQTIYRRTDVPFQGSPLLEEDEDEYSRFRWSGVPDFHPSVQSTIINQSTGTGSSDLSQCYSSVDSKTLQEEREEPKLGQDLKPGKGSSQGMSWERVIVRGKEMRVRSDVLARYKAAYLVHMRSQSVSQNLLQSPVNPVKVPMSSSPVNSCILEGSDNLKILAEEAVRVREATVAEAKCKSELAANLNLPLKKRKSLPSVANNSCNRKELINGEASYPSAPMLSIAQVEGLNKSVIVMNSQYSWPSGPGTVSSVTQAKKVSHSATASGDSCPSNTPLDMTACRQTPPAQATDCIPAPRNCDNFVFNCKVCNQATCQSSCPGITSISLKCCQKPNCFGSCRKTPFPAHNSAVLKCVHCLRFSCSGKCRDLKESLSTTPKCDDKLKSHEKNHKTINGILKTRPPTGTAPSKCLQCHGSYCGDHCKNFATSSDGVKAQKVTFQVSPTKTVLKCIQCKSFGCDGKCMTSHSRCSTSASSNRKTSRCVLCKISSCNGSCKSAVVKCVFCSSGNCEGSCHPSGRSTNNSLSTVNDFSILTSSVFTDKHVKCSVCKNNCCGRCKNAAGLKYCPYCMADVYNGNNTNHSIRSILGASSKSKAEITAVAQKRSKATSSGRRTRSSSSVSKQFVSPPVNDAPSFSVEDAKRRKKSLSKPVAR